MQHDREVLLGPFVILIVKCAAPVRYVLYRSEVESAGSTARDSAICSLFARPHKSGALAQVIGVGRYLTSRPPSAQR